MKPETTRKFVLDKGLRPIHGEIESEDVSGEHGVASRYIIHLREHDRDLGTLIFQDSLDPATDDEYEWDLSGVTDPEIANIITKAFEHLDGPYRLHVALVGGAFVIGPLVGAFTWEDGTIWG